LRTYEGLFLLNSHRANRDWEEVFGHVTGILKKHGAELISHEKWGERKLAYPVRGEKRGTYLLTYFRATGDAPNRIYRDCEISEIILRALILATTEVPSAPAARSPEGEAPSTSAAPSTEANETKAIGEESDAEVIPDEADLEK